MPHGVTDPEAALPIGEALLGSQPVPADAFRFVLEDASPIEVTGPEAVLRRGETLLGSQPVPADGFRFVFEDTLPGVVHESESGLRSGVALLSGLSVLRNTTRLKIVFRQRYRDGEDTRYDCGCSREDPFEFLVYRLQMRSNSPPCMPITKTFGAVTAVI